MEIRHYLQLLRKGWWIVLLTALIALNTAFIVAYFTEPVYLASAKFIVSPNPSVVTGYDVVNSLEALDKRSIVATYGEFLNSRRIYLNALEALRLSPDTVEDYTLTAVVLPDANILELTVTGSNPQLVASIANMVGSLTIDYVSHLYRAYDVSVLDAAIAPLTPISPQPVRDAGLALVLGIIAGVSLAILSEQIRIPLDTYRNRLRMDTTTGVYKRQYFERLVENELTQSPGEALSLGIVELSGLEELSETLPANATNWILQQVTDVLRKELRGNDAIARWNKNSFILMLPLTPSIAASRTFERIYQSIKRPVDLPQYDITINLDPHIGGAVYSNNISL
ncbi:MAG: hypothetical protein DRI32_04170, partial [Chloroflexi bacterium]